MLFERCRASGSLRIIFKGFHMDKLIRESGKLWICLVVIFLSFGPFDARGQEDSDPKQPTAADLNKTETGVPTAASESTDRVLEVIKKVLTYPLIKLGKGNLTLQSLLILGLLFIFVLVAEKIVRERIIMCIFDKT